MLSSCLPDPRIDVDYGSSIARLTGQVLQNAKKPLCLCSVLVIAQNLQFADEYPMSLNEYKDPKTLQPYIEIDYLGISYQSHSAYERSDRYGRVRWFTDYRLGPPRVASWRDKCQYEWLGSRKISRICPIFPMSLRQMELFPWDRCWDLCYQLDEPNLPIYVFLRAWVTNLHEDELSFQLHATDKGAYTIRISPQLLVRMITRSLPQLLRGPPVLDNAATFRHQPLDHRKASIRLLKFSLDL